MRSTIALNGSFFNTHRMLQEYISNAYFPDKRAAVPHPLLESALAK
jgi:starch phosphorylase